MKRPIRLVPQRRNLVRAAVTAIVATAALVAVQAAGAHTTDSLHQHGWNTTLMWDPIVQCGQPAFYGTNGLVRFSPPNVITSPTTPDGKAQWVVFMADLQQWNYDSRLGWRWVKAGDLGAYYTLANQYGNALSGWFNASTGFPVVGMIGDTNVKPGYFYRVRVLYGWMDGQVHEDYTNYCKV